jgi:formiminoglutamate deiminase
MTTYWCELAWLGGETAAESVVVEVEGERIAGLEKGVAAPEGATRLEGITIPGLANAHSHAFQRALRSRTQAGRGDFWTWRDAMYELASRLDPDGYLALARATYAEMALAGITCVGEFHYLHHGPGGSPYSDPNAMGHAVIEAASEAGIRITLLDTCYLHGGIGGQLAGAQRRFGDADADAWSERVAQLRDGDGSRIGAAVHSVRAVDPASAATVAAWAGEREMPLHAHLSEQPAENEASRRAYGGTPTTVLADAGALGARFTAVHGTHLGQPDFRALGGAGATCCVCPTTERDLADGIADAERLRSAGAGGRARRASRARDARGEPGLRAAPRRDPGRARVSRLARRRETRTRGARRPRDGATGHAAPGGSRPGDGRGGRGLRGDGRGRRWGDRLRSGGRP